MTRLRRVSFHRRWHGTLPIMCALVLGCSRGALVPVAGTCTYQGQPLPSTFLCFESLHGGQSWDTTDELGRFELRTFGNQTGAAPGKYRVWVRYQLPEPAPGEPAGDRGRILALPQALEDRYQRDLRALPGSYRAAARPENSIRLTDHRTFATAWAMGLARGSECQAWAGNSRTTGEDPRELRAYSGGRRGAWIPRSGPRSVRT
jgi:hypothetical protein